MSLSLHLASAVVLIILLIIIRRLAMQKVFLLNLVATLKPNHKQLHVDYPINFLRNFALLFKIKHEFSQKLNLKPAPIRASNFLDFYLKHGIRIIHVSVNQQGKPVVLLTPESKPDKERLDSLSSCCGKDITVKVVDLC